MHKRNLIFILPILILIIFIVSVWDKNFYVGGDLTFPLNPQNNILKSIFLWGEQNGGGNSLMYSLLFWQAFFYLLSLLGLQSYLLGKFFIGFLYILGFIFTYLSYRVLFKGTRFDGKKLAVFAGLLFNLNPSAFIVPGGYPPLYGFPICFYFLLRFLEKRKIINIIPFALFLNFTFFSDFPQPKVFVVFILSMIFLLLIYFHLHRPKLIRLFLDLFKASILTVLLNAIVLLPFIKDVFSSTGIYQYYSKEVTIYGGNADLYLAALPFISRFYNSNLAVSEWPLGEFLKNPIFITWTFILWVIILLSTFFAKEKREKRLIYLLFLSLVSFIFIAKGANPPFEKIYYFLLFHVPFMKIFRTTSSVVLGGVMFYIFLLTISVYYLSKKIPKSYYLILFINLIIFYPVYSALKFDNQIGKNLYQKGVSIPSEYFQMGKFLDNLNDQAKVFIFPQDNGYVSKNWRYTGQSPLSWITKKPLIHGGINARTDIDNLTSENKCLLFSLYNVGYFLYEKDTIGVISAENMEIPGQIIINNNYFSLYKINSDCFQPRIYASNKIVNFQGQPNGIFSLSPFLINNENPVFYILGKNGLENKSSEKITGNFFVESLSENQKLDMVGRNFVRLYLGNSGLIDVVFYPYVRIRPDSLFYPLVLMKEKKNEQGSVENKRQLLDKKLFFASKRISEISKWGVNNSWWKKTLTLYEEKMNEAIKLANTGENRSDDLELVTEYVDRHQQKIEKLIKDNAFWDNEKVISWNNVFRQLSKQAKSVNILPQFDKFNHDVDLPILGDYQIYLTLDSGKPILSRETALEVLLNGEKIASLSGQQNNNDTLSTFDLGSYAFKSKNNHLEINFPTLPNLIEQVGWQKLSWQSSFDIGKNGITIINQENETNTLPDNASVVFQEIKDWQPEEIYNLRINYQKDDSAVLHVLIREDRKVFNEKSNNWEKENSVLADDALSSEENYNILLKANKNIIGAKIYLYTTDGLVNIKNISLKKIIIPKLIFKRLNDNENLKNVLPKITFTEVNPVNYKVNVAGATDPFLLVLSESYNKDWKVMIGKGKSLSEDKHFLVNGYANAWYIAPVDFNNQQDYSLVIEYSNQRLFYIGSIVSILAFMGILIFSYVKKS